MDPSFEFHNPIRLESHRERRATTVVNQSPGHRLFVFELCVVGDTGLKTGWGGDGDTVVQILLLVPESPVWSLSVFNQT